MIWSWADLDAQEQETVRIIKAFINKRLAEQGTIDWALNLKPHQRNERIAIEDLLTGFGAQNLSEPWASAWRLIQESWLTPQTDGLNGTAIYSIQQRLRAGDRSGAVISAIVDLVKPRLSVKAFEASRWSYVKKPHKPKIVEHILSARITSGELIDLNLLELENISDAGFLVSLANALEASVNHGLDIAKRLGKAGKMRLWLLGELRRAYYVARAPKSIEDGDPDAFHQGIAPSVKLLHAVVVRISELDLAVTQDFVRRWKSNGSPVHIRLWAALSREVGATPINEVVDFFMAIGRDQFWDVHGFPEVAELRARRFRELNVETQKAIVATILKGPPNDHWPKRADPAEIESARLYWSFRELRRIEVGGGILPDRARSRFDAWSARFPDLAEMKIDEGFPGGVIVTSREAQPETKFDALSGVERLRAIEATLGTGRGGWEDDPAERANAWTSQLGNADKLLGDFETSNNGGDDFPKVWNRFGWAHKPRQQDGQAALNKKPEDEAARVLGLLYQLSNETLLNAIEGICDWLDNWRKHIVKLQLTLPIWLRIWPIAVVVTNLKPERTEDEDLTVIRNDPNNDSDHVASAALNTPTGKLVGLFLSACPSLEPGTQVFSADSVERQMRDIVIAANGRSGLIAKHRLIEALPYFLHADPRWAKEYLIAPLLKDDAAALALWRAVARHTHFTKVLESIGTAMVERANDRRLGRDTRRRLVFSLVVESLHAFREERAPAVSNQLIQQMLRTQDDEVRASAANAIQMFVRDLSSKPPPDQFVSTREGVFTHAAAPFLRNVWPQERSLATPGISRALADLPATAGEAFADAVEAIKRFLVPFDCWSMQDYGLYGKDGDLNKLASIDSPPKALAFLQLLDFTIGTTEVAVIPHDLPEALDQIRSIVPALVDSNEFRRLATALRK
jgi:hypothetical protein